MHFSCMIKKQNRTVDIYQYNLYSYNFEKCSLIYDMKMFPKSYVEIFPLFSL